MLKIKDSVDLKGLEKFGFEKDKNTYYFKNVCNAIVLMVFDNRKISNPEDDQGNEVLYDLIQAGLVEKVEEER